MMLSDDYDYDLPPDAVAQTPAEPRDSARLLVLHRRDGRIAFHVFRDLPGLLRDDDVLVVNDSRVLPARLRGVRAPSGGAVEVLLLHRLPTHETTGLDRDDYATGTADEGGEEDAAVERWVALVKPGRRIRPGEDLTFGDGVLTAVVTARHEGGERVVELRARAGSVRDALARVGATPLPPYIRVPLADPERYQTVYARAEGSVAAPTAGLHITQDTLDGLAARGIPVYHVTLHVGAGTFKPMAEGSDPAAHVMHGEWAALDRATADALTRAKVEGRRIVAVGTTTVRVLESAAALSPPGTIAPFEGWTDIFIRPGHVFRAVDALVTNFHLPRSTLLLLVSALAGKDNIERAYAAALAEHLRFYSFGDAMLIDD